MRRLWALGVAFGQDFFQRLYGWLGPRFFSRNYFERRYSKPDPWHYQNSPYEQLKYQRTLEILPKREFKKILEIGCSEGVFTQKIAGLTQEVLGVDISTMALERAQRRCAHLKNVRFQPLDIVKDQIENGFDLIFCAEVLYYLGKREVLQKICAKIVGSLTYDGYLVLVNAWPASKRLHLVFQEHPQLQLVQEEVYEDKLRPYAISLFKKRRSQVGTLTR